MFCAIGRNHTCVTKPARRLTQSRSEFLKERIEYYDRIIADLQRDLNDVTDYRQCLVEQRDAVLYRERRKRA
jgi:hypothetical protein